MIGGILLCEVSDIFEDDLSLVLDAMATTSSIVFAAPSKYIVVNYCKL